MYSSIYRALSQRYKVDLRKGDYPYAAWYSKESFDKGEWEGYWFAKLPLNDLPYVVFIPDHYSDNMQLFGFLHEVGHIVHKHMVWLDKIDTELVAWDWAYDYLLHNNLLTIESDREFFKYLEDCLLTYTKNNVDLHRILHFIGLLERR